MRRKNRQNARFSGGVVRETAESARFQPRKLTSLTEPVIVEAVNQSAPSQATALRLPPKRLLLPYLGDLPLVALAPEFMLERYRRFGPIFRSSMFGRPTVVMVGPEAVRFVLSTGMHHFSWQKGWPKNFTDLLGHGLFVQDGAEHARNRAALAPAFRGKALSGYVPKMEQLALKHMRRWEQLGELTFHPEVKKLTFEVAANLMFGVDNESDNDRLSALFTTLVGGIFSLPLRVPGSAFSKALKARVQLREFVDAAIEARIREPREDALGLLVAARDGTGNPLPREELKDHAILLAFAGHDTTTSMLTSMCLRLAQNPEVLRRCREEQFALNLGAELSTNDLGRMTYLDQVLKEIERLDPPVAAGMRGVIEPFQFAGYDVPAGYLCQYHIAATHRDAGIYDDILRFDPDRFSNERAEHRRQAFSLVGFGGGPRICLGMGFSQAEMKVIASHLLRSYAWDLVPGQNTRMLTVPTAHPVDGLKLRFRRL